MKAKRKTTVNPLAEARLQHRLNWELDQIAATGLREVLDDINTIRGNLTRAETAEAAAHKKVLERKRELSNRRSELQSKLQECYIVGVSLETLRKEAKLKTIGQLNNLLKAKPAEIVEVTEDADEPETSSAATDDDTAAVTDGVLN